MAVKIRLQQTGKRNARSFRMVAVDESEKRDGRVLEYLGFITKSSKTDKSLIKYDRVEYWQKLGATPTIGALKYLKHS